MELTTLGTRRPGTLLQGVGAEEGTRTGRKGHRHCCGAVDGKEQEGGGSELKHIPVGPLGSGIIIPGDQALVQAARHRTQPAMRGLAGLTLPLSLLLLLLLPPPTPPPPGHHHTHTHTGHLSLWFLTASVGSPGRVRLARPKPRQQGTGPSQ